MGAAMFKYQALIIIIFQLTLYSITSAYIWKRVKSAQVISAMGQLSRVNSACSLV